VSSASIGQVHWAHLVTGEEVAVKVLNPGIERMLRSDLGLLRWTLPLLRQLLGFQSTFQIPGICPGSS
jgi:ubiquinone biosynthesis protein